MLRFKIWNQDIVELLVHRLAALRIFYVDSFLVVLHGFLVFTDNRTSNFPAKIFEDPQ